jgi:hypothetical protein
MSRSERRDEYLDEEIVEEFESVADSAEEFFDRLVIRGRNSETRQLETVNLFTEKIRSRRELQRDPQNPGMPDPSEIREQFREAKIDANRGDRLSRAVAALLSEASD